MTLCEEEKVFSTIAKHLENNNRLKKQNKK
jgi:hypothetical protein